MIDGLVTDLIEATSERLESLGLDSPEAVRENESGVVGFSESVENARLQLKDFLFERFYNHPSVLRATKRAESVVDNLFQTLSGKPELLPEGVRARFAVEGELRAIADYVAGMTDRFARAEHDRHRAAAVAVDS
jgi:dGTPase